MDNACVTPKLLPFHLLEQITNGFSMDRKLGAGSYGNVYMGEPAEGETIAVKLLHYIPGLDGEQFEKEYHNLASLQHKNIVQLVGYSHETHRECLPYDGKMVFAEMTKRALCFEYMPNGSLDKFLSDESSGLDWCTRYAIIKGICEGIQYLHEELDSPMCHLDLKPANILLDENMVPKIADFGLSRLLGGERTQTTNSVIGTHGYVPPEYVDAAVISIKFDIFSLGVIIIRIMTGPTCYFRSVEMSPEQFIELVHGNWKNRLQTTALNESYSEQAKRCIEIALRCVDADRHKRPSIGVIIDQLNETETVIQFLEASRNDTGSYEMINTCWLGLGATNAMDVHPTKPCCCDHGMPECGSCRGHCCRPSRVQEPERLAAAETKKRASPPRHFYLPVLKAAPFIVCANCLKLLRVPASFEARNYQVRSLRCGACLVVLSYSYRVAV